MFNKKKKNRKMASMITFILCLVLVVGAMDSFAGNASTETNQADQTVATDSAIQGDEPKDEPEQNDKNVITPEDNQNKEKPKPQQKVKAKPKRESISTQSDDDMYDVSATWGSNGPTTTAIEDGSTKNLVVKIDGNGKQQANNNHKLVISYAHIDTSDYTEENGETGIQISDYDGRSGFGNDDPLKSVVTNIKNDTVNKQLIYTLSDQTFVQIGINVSFKAAGDKAYLGEKLDIATQFYKDDNIASEKLRNIAEANMNTGYARSYTRLQDPGLLSDGAGSGYMDYYVYNFSKDLHGTNANVTYDFSNAIITAKGETKKYIEWLEEYKGTGNDVPFKITYKDGSELDKNSQGYDTKATLDVDRLSVSTDFDLIKYVKTDEFVSSGSALASLDLRQVDTTIKFFQNRRGPEFQMAYAANAESAAELVKTKNFAFYILDNVFRSSGSLDSITYNLRPMVAGGSYIQPNSVKYSGKSLDDKGFLHYQPLFRVYAKTARTEETAKGKVDTIKVTIPEGVNVTHIRVPKVTSDQANYKSIEYDNVEYMPGSMIEISDSSKREFELKINELILFSDSYYTNMDTLVFLGTTNNLTEGESIKFSLNGSGDTKIRSLETKVLNDKGISFSPYIGKGTFIGEKNNSGNITAISKTNPTKGTSIYMSTNVQTHAYAYSSVWMMDPLKIGTSEAKSLSPNPVAYFNVPAGFDVGDINVTGQTKSADGKTITPYYVKEHANAGKWAADGGKLVEVKLAGPSGEDILVTTGYTIVNLELNIPIDYDGGQVTFKKEDIGVNTWYENSKSISGTPSQGYLHDIDFPESALAVNKGKYIINASNGLNGYSQEIDPTLPIGATIQGSVRLSDGTTYMPYSPNKPESVPVRPAGSDNEEFKLNVIYNLETQVDDGRVYFLLPQNDGWRPSLNQKPKLETNIDNDKYTIYYTKEDVRNENMDNGGDIVTSWTKLTSSTSASELAAIKGFKVEFSKLTLGDNFTMLMPYEIPSLSGNVDWNDEAKVKAIGQTQYFLGGSLKADNAATAALKLRKTDKPVIKAVSDDNKEAEMPGTTQTFKYKDSGATLPSWYKAITYDDFTANLKLENIKIEYIKQGGNESDKVTNSFGASKISTTPYQPVSQGAIEYKNGYINEIDFGASSATDYLSLDKPGEYKIIYTTAEDADKQSTVLTRSIKIEKGGLDTINVNSKAISMFYDQPLSEIGSTATWDDLFRTKLTVTDDGIKIDSNSSNIKIKSIVTLTDSQDTISNSEVEKIVSDHGPGKYEITYIYDDGYGSSRMVSVPLTVKYRGIMTVNVWSPSTSKNVSDASVSLNTEAAVKTNVSGNVTFDISATDSDPINANYKVELKDIPNGYVMPETKTLSGTKNENNIDIPVIFSASPVSINAVFEGNDNSNIVKNISLYQKNGTKVAGPIDTKDLASYRFDPKEINGMDILSGKYYMQLEINNGYKPSTGSDFTVKDTSDDSVLITADIDVLKSHIQQTAKFEEYNHDIVFKAGSNGSLNSNGDKTVTIGSVAHGATWGATTKDEIPAPVGDEGYYFDGWDITFPSADDKIKDDLAFTAVFKAKKNITMIAADPGNVMYNGKEQSAQSTVKLDGTLLSGHSYKNNLKATAKGTNVGTYKTEIPKPSQANFEGLDGKAPEYYYNITYKQADFKITKSTALNVTAQDNNVTYDGKTHGISSIKATRTGAELLYSKTGKSGSFTKTAPKFTEVGTHKVYVTAKLNNYEDAKVVDATVDITKRNITIKPVDVTATYTGEKISPKKEVNVVDGNLVNGQKVDLSSAKFAGARTQVGSNAIKVSDVKINGNKTDNYKISYSQGTMTINADNSGGGGGNTISPTTPGGNISNPEGSTDSRSRVEDISTNDDGYQNDGGTGTYSPTDNGTSSTIEKEGIPTVGIGNNKVPLFGNGSFDSWSLINIIVTIAGIILALIAAAQVLMKRSQMGFSPLWLISSILIAIILAGITGFSGDYSGVMTLFDGFTIPVAALFVGQILCILRLLNGEMVTSHNDDIDLF